ncbi:hypothetical protein F2Q68_00005197 [Brassica cretica]|uniref:Uncharacterized protein n=1 Tax=Brassica cretica TaxID=69181 RepID=A0A8S9JBF9_BRACR|nr:hypothetical protein F2Q68_00005197 [Brassica cretica]
MRKSQRRRSRKQEKKESDLTPNRAMTKGLMTRQKRYPPEPLGSPSLASPTLPDKRLGMRNI